MRRRTAGFGPSATIAGATGNARVASMAVELVGMHAVEGRRPLGQVTAAAIADQPVDLPVRVGFNTQRFEVGDAARPPDTIQPARPRMEGMNAPEYRYLPRAATSASSRRRAAARSGTAAG